MRHIRYYNWVLAIVVESGAIYSGILLLGLVLWQNNATAMIIIGAAVSQVVVSYVRC